MATAARPADPRIPAAMVIGGRPPAVASGGTSAGVVRTGEGGVWSAAAAGRVAAENVSAGFAVARATGTAGATSSGRPAIAKTGKRPGEVAVKLANPFAVPPGIVGSATHLPPV